jgi:hypothetical protein
MARHSITVNHLFVHEKYRTSTKRPLGSLRAGDDLLHLLHGLLVDSAVTDDKALRYLSIETVRPLGRTLLVEAQVGRHGEPGNTVNVRTHAVEHARGRDSSSTVPARALAVVPEAGQDGLLFFEHVGGLSPSADILRLLEKAFKHRYGDEFMLKTPALVEPQAWLDAAKLETVTAVAHSWSSDIADQAKTRVLGRRRIVTSPPEGQRFFPDLFWQALRSGTYDRAKLLGVTEGDIDEIVVEAEANGRGKKFILGKERRPSVRHLLADKDEPEPDADAVRAFCLDLAPDLLSAVGGGWDRRWEAGAWSAEALATRMEVPDDV